MREAIAKTFYPGLISADEVFVSDGSKCDIARLQVRSQRGSQHRFSTVWVNDTAELKQRLTLEAAYC